MKKTELKKYASLIARTGAGIVKGDEVIIQAELDQPEFVEMLVTECYRAGAKKVTVEWSHQPLQKLHVRYRSLKTLSSVEDWEVEKLRRRTEVAFTPELRQEVRTLLAEMHDLYSRGRTPKVRPTKGCSACSLKELCLPKLMRGKSVSAYLGSAMEGTG